MAPAATSRAFPEAAAISGFRVLSLGATGGLVT